MSSTAQTSSQVSVPQQTPERELKDEIPKHVPIKVKVKNLNSEKWTRDLEVEVTNTGDKPIFFLFLILSLPDVQSDTNRVMSFQLIYGRDDLVDFTAPLQPTDIAIKPGERYSLKISAPFSVGWERFAERKALEKTEPKRIRVRLGEINFGDGTGFMGTDGARMGDRQQSSQGLNIRHEKKREQL